MNADAGDGQRLVEADVCECFAAVDRFVDAVALDDVAAQLGLAHADIHDVRVRLGDGDGADRRRREEFVGDRRAT